MVTSAALIKEEKASEEVGASYPQFVTVHRPLLILGFHTLKNKINK